MDEKYEGRRSTSLLTILSIATLLVALVGATFAYFTATVTDGDKGSSVIIQTATLSIIYHDGNNLQVSGIVPGWSDSKVVSIENPTDYAAVYTLRWKAGMFNNLDPKSELVYTISCTGSDAPSTIEDAVVPGSDPATTEVSNILQAIRVPANTTHTCTLAFSFLEMSSIQNYNQTKTFFGTLELVAEAVSTEP